MSRLVSVTCLMIIGSISVLQATALAQEATSTNLPPHVRGTIAWLPPDSDTLHVAQGFAIPDTGPASQNRSERDHRRCAQLPVLEGLFEPEHAKFFKPLVGKQVLAAVRGQRNAETVSSFGALRSEGCSILHFEEDLGEAARELTTLLRDGSLQVRKHNGHEVFALASTVVMEPWVQPKPWQGTFVVLLTSKRVLCASSDKYLAYVLDHLDSWSPEQPFPLTLGEWSHVDTTAPGWMLRHIAPISRQSILGVTMTCTKDQAGGLRPGGFPVSNAAILGVR